jgi:hypothetical protein
MKLRLLCLFLFLALPLRAAAQEIGTVTLMEGSLRVIRGTTVLQGAAGVRLQQGDFIESSDRGFAQLEFTGGTIVALGASSRLFLFRNAARRNTGKAVKAAAVEVVVLRGWLKGETGSNAGSCRYASPVLGAATSGGTIVLHATAQAAEIFVESGSAEASEITPDGNWGRKTGAKAGQFLSRRSDKSIAVSARPDSVFVESMPRPFRDTLPSRMSLFAGKPAQAKRDHEVSYSEIQPWLTMGQTWRRGFVERFQPRLKDVTFRKALEDHLADHPEWDPVLHPEKYQPKTTSSAVDVSDFSHSRY